MIIIIIIIMKYPNSDGGLKYLMNGRVGHRAMMRRRHRGVPIGSGRNARGVRWPWYIGQWRRRVTRGRGFGQHRIVGAGSPSPGRVVRRRNGLCARFGRRFFAIFVPVKRRRDYWKGREHKRCSGYK